MPTEDDLGQVNAAAVRMLDDLESLTDPDVRADTLLPGWTRGHLLTHLARASDSLGRLVQWARTGIEHPQYASMDARAAEIEAGAARGAADLVQDVRSAGDRLDRAFRSLPDPAWSVQVRPRTGELCTARRLVFIRLRELEMHHVDLALGYRFAAIPPPVAGRIIDDIVGTLAVRSDTPRMTLVAAETAQTWSLGAARPLVRGLQPDLLGWLSGRSGDETLSTTDHQPIPKIPPWL